MPSPTQGGGWVRSFVLGRVARRWHSQDPSSVGFWHLRRHEQQAGQSPALPRGSLRSRYSSPSPRPPPPAGITCHLDPLAPLPPTSSLILTHSPPATRGAELRLPPPALGVQRGTWLGRPFTTQDLARWSLQLHLGTSSPPYSSLLLLSHQELSSAQDGHALCPL